MNEQAIIQTEHVSFKDFLLKNKRNKITLVIAAIAIVVQFSIFKYLYPFASYIHGDSFSYLNAADRNLTINTYLIGYSKFLRLFSVFAKPDYMLVAFQYLLIQFSTLFLLFTIIYFYQPGKLIKTILLIFLVLNPLFLHLANMVSSDGFFLSLSCAWFALLLWIIHRPTMKIIIWNAVVLAIAFTVRYNAMIYPFIAIVAISISNIPLRKKILGSALGLVLCGSFMLLTMHQYKKLTGYWQYSPFSGWQFANNAMYAYRYVDKEKRKPVPPKFQKLDNMIREFYDSTRDTKKYPSEAMKASTIYMWTQGMPLYKYRNKVVFKDDSIASEFKKWATMGPFFKSYGTYIIKQYPLHFLEHFVWPNSMKYYAPPVEFLERYNSGNDYVTPETKTWFGYKTQKIKTRMKDKDVWVLSFYPILSGIINVTMLFLLVSYLCLKGWRFNKEFRPGLCIAAFFWIVNAGFTIFASSAALRFQSFPIILTSVFVLLLFDWILKLIASMKELPVSEKKDNKEMEIDWIPG